MRFIVDWRAGHAVCADVPPKAQPAATQAAPPQQRAGQQRNRRRLQWESSVAVLNAEGPDHCGDLVLHAAPPLLVRARQQRVELACNRMHSDRRLAVCSRRHAVQRLEPGWTAVARQTLHTS